jgi:membrane-associated protein
VLTALLGLAAGWPAPAVLVIGAAVLVAESGTFAGVLLPGTSIVVALGLWSDAAGIPTGSVIAVAASATVAGAHLGWWRGARPAAAGCGPGRPVVAAVRRRTAAAVRRFGAQGPAATTVVLAAGHWASAARAVVPRVAGDSGVPYRLAGPALAVSGTAWATTLVLVGRTAGPYVITRGGWVLLAVVLVLIGVLACRGSHPAPAGR